MVTNQWFGSIIWVLICLISLALCAEDYYQILGISNSATEKEIKRAYRQLGRDYHPDKNPGNEEAHSKFLAISEAYSTLIDPKLRSIYDNQGLEGLKRHKQSGGRSHPQNPFDLFAQFFGGGGGGGSGRKTGPNREVHLNIPLHDFYTGTTATFSLSKQVVCNACSGTGNKDKRIHQCPQCRGSGFNIQQLQIAPGLFQRVQTQCQACSGSGNKIHHPCPVCNGQRVVSMHEDHTITVEPGMPSGITITLENEADESPDWDPGDLLVKLVQRTPQPPSEDTPDNKLTDGTFFRRRGSELIWREVLGLREAWMGGWTRELRHLDGHIVKLGRKRGQVVQPGTVETIQGEGMPVWDEGKTDGRGNLLVEYVVILPDQMESGMEKEFWSVWEKWRKKVGVNWKDDREEMKKERREKKKREEEEEQRKRREQEEKETLREEL